MPKNLAFKCTYNNGGEGILVGFEGACSPENIKRNIDNGRVWCSQQQCDCSQYYGHAFKGRPPEYPCDESKLFVDWEMGGGRYHHGARAGQPIPVMQSAVGKLAVLTTRFPGQSERDRKIIGFFKIGRISRPNAQGDKAEYVFSAQRDARVRLPLEEAKELFFWKYYSTRAGAVWCTGLFRYLSDAQVVAMLLDLNETVRDERARCIIGDLLKADFQGVVAETGKTTSVSRIERSRRIARLRKYGPGGEGEDHKRLKKWTAENPRALGLMGVRCAETEYVFPCGDAVDVLFEHTDGKFTVVEVETNQAFPGNYQALKYKALKCAELGQELDSYRVQSMLVAWDIPEEIRAFCGRYGIVCFEKRV